MSFLLPSDLDAVSVQELHRACVAGGPDNMPWPTRVELDAERFSVYRSVDESGFLLVPWEIEGYGRLMANTATLMERPGSYSTQIELTRGKLNQLRGQFADWQAGGLVVPAALERCIHEAGACFSQAVTAPPEEQNGPGTQRCLVLGYQAAEQLVSQYMGQVFQVRQQRNPPLTTLLGCRLSHPLDDDAADRVAGFCNCVSIAFPWSSIEASEGNYDWQAQDALLDWAEERGLAVTGGPLIDFSAAQMPDWLWLYERDLPMLRKFMLNYITAAVKRYRKRIRRWHLTSASNNANILSLGEEELLYLTIKLTQTARQIDPAVELIVGITQPWGEYMAAEDRTHSPFIFADTLIRSELQLNALDLELVMGVMPRGSYCRDLLETSKLLDLYAVLGLPLRVSLGFPSRDIPDPKADPELRAGAGRWHSGYSSAVQAEWASSFVALALCKPFVQAVHWCQSTDRERHQFPHCGLFDAQGQAKPVLDSLLQLRERHVT